jgi:hypothetical protein
MNREAISKTFHVYFGHLVDQQGKRVKPAELVDWFMDNVAIHLSHQGENQRASVARDEDQGVAADNQISLSPELAKFQKLYSDAYMKGNEYMDLWEKSKADKEALEKIIMGHETTILEQEEELERLRGEREAWNGEKRDLLDALEELMSWQNGAPLPTYQKGWTAAMERGEALLTKNKQP